MNDKEKFYFVSLDYDLYDLILEGFKYFYPKMVSGWEIFIHDFYSELEGFKSVKKAIKEFQKENDVKILPVEIIVQLWLLNHK